MRCCEEVTQTSGETSTAWADKVKCTSIIWVEALKEVLYEMLSYLTFNSYERLR